MGPRLRGDDMRDGVSKPCQSGALHLVSGPFGAPFWAAQDAVVAQLVRAPVCGTGGRWFEPTQLYHFSITYADPLDFCLFFVSPCEETRILRTVAYISSMRWRSSYSVRPAPGFIEPCVPTVAKRAPMGPDWVYEIKHDGYRLMVRKDDERVRVYTRRGADWTERFPRIVQAARRLKVRSFLVDGEGVVYDKKGVPNFALLHSREYDKEASLAAFDLLELDGADVRKQKLLDRKKHLARLLKAAKDGIEFNVHLEGEGSLIFEHACKLGFEGIVAKRVDLAYESGRSRRWLKIKNPDSAAAKRVEEGSF
jgi:bifunctional non-homologous end joining protein LigD